MSFTHPYYGAPNYPRPPQGSTWVPPGYPDSRPTAAMAAAAAAGAAQGRPNGQWAQFGHWPMRPAPKPVSHEYLSTPLKDNPLGLTGMDKSPTKTEHDTPRARPDRSGSISTSPHVSGASGTKLYERGGSEPPPSSADIQAYYELRHRHSASRPYENAPRSAGRQSFQEDRHEYTNSQAHFAQSPPSTATEDKTYDSLPPLVGPLQRPEKYRRGGSEPPSADATSTSFPVLPDPGLLSQRMQRPRRYDRGGSEPPADLTVVRDTGAVIKTDSAVRIEGWRTDTAKLAARNSHQELRQQPQVELNNSLQRSSSQKQQQRYREPELSTPVYSSDNTHRHGEHQPRVAHSPARHQNFDTFNYADIPSPTVPKSTQSSTARIYVSPSKQFPNHPTRSNTSSSSGYDTTSTSTASTTKPVKRAQTMPDPLYGVHTGYSGYSPQKQPAAPSPGLVRDPRTSTSQLQRSDTEVYPRSDSPTHMHDYTYANPHHNEEQKRYDAYQDSSRDKRSQQHTERAPEWDATREMGPRKTLDGYEYLQTQQGRIDHSPRTSTFTSSNSLGRHSSMPVYSSASISPHHLNQVTEEAENLLSSLDIRGDLPLPEARRQSHHEPGSRSHSASRSMSHAEVAPMQNSSSPRSFHSSPRNKDPHSDSSSSSRSPYNAETVRSHPSSAGWTPHRLYPSSSSSSANTSPYQPPSHSREPSPNPRRDSANDYSPIAIYAQSHTPESISPSRTNFAYQYGAPEDAIKVSPHQVGRHSSVPITPNRSPILRDPSPSRAHTTPSTRPSSYRQDNVNHTHYENPSPRSNPSPHTPARGEAAGHHTPSPLHTSSGPYVRSPSRARQQTGSSGSGRNVRKGYWNQRGDYLTPDGFVVYCPPNRTYPKELVNYPEDGFMDHTRRIAPEPPTGRYKELPASISREGIPPSRPYDTFIEYVLI